MTPCSFHTQLCLIPPSSRDQFRPTSLTILPPLDTPALKQLTPSGESYKALLPGISLSDPRYNPRVANQSPAMAEPEVQAHNTATQEVQTHNTVTREVQTHNTETQEVQTHNTGL